MTLDRDERVERQDTARTVLRVGTGLLAVTLLISVVLQPRPLLAHAPYAAMVLAHLLTLLLVGRGHLRVAITGFATFYLAVVLGSVAEAGAQIAPAGFALPPIVLFVGLTLSGRAALVTAFAASAGVLGVVAADNAGLLREAPLTPPVRLWLVATTSSLITGAMLYAALRIIRESRQRTAAAQQARQELEARLVQTRRLETVGRLAAGVAHDFNNVLTVIFAETSRLERGDARTAASAANIRAAADRAAALARQLLSVGRRQVREPERLDLVEVVRQFAGLLGRLVGDDVRLVLELGDGTPAVEVDRLEVEQVLLNLVTNARDAMPRGGTLTVSVAAATAALVARCPALGGRRGVALVVRDTGAGIPADVRERLFEPFFTTKPIGQGTGLGLATVAAIAAQAGGAVLVDSEPGAGATFTVVLPEAPVGAARRDRAATPPPAVGAAAATILVVEDDELVRGAIVAILGDGGHQVTAAASGAAALAAVGAAPRPPDLLITDVIMSDLAGPELAQRLRALHPALRVLFVSGHAEERLSERGVMAEGVHFVAKPFARVALLEKVAAVLASDHPGAIGPPAAR